MGPTAELQDRVTLADYRGGPTVVNLFASWCVECDRELPGFARVSNELREQVQFRRDRLTGDRRPDAHAGKAWS